MAILGTRGIPARYGGFETFAEQISTRLAARLPDWRIGVYCDSALGTRLSHRYGQVFREYITVPFKGVAHRLAYDAACLLHAAARYDIIYMLGYSSVLFGLVARYYERSFWVNPDGLEWARSKWPWYGRFYLRLMERTMPFIATRIIADSEAIAIHLRESYGDLSGLCVIPYGVEMVAESGQREISGVNASYADYPYFLVVARLVPENNVHMIIKAFQQAKTSIPLIVVGPTDSDNAYHAMLRSLAGSNVEFAGGIYDRQELGALRCNALAYIHGHSVGGTNPSLLEAMAVGSVILAHDNSFNREVAAGTAVYFKDENDLAARLDAVEGMSATARNRAKVCSQRRAAAAYSWESVVAKYVDLLVESGGRAY